MFHEDLNWVLDLKELSVEGACHRFDERHLILVLAFKSVIREVRIQFRDRKAQSVLYLLLWATVHSRVFVLVKVLGSLQLLYVRFVWGGCAAASGKYLSFELYLKGFYRARAFRVITIKFYLYLFPRVVLLLVENDVSDALRTAKSEDSANFVLYYSLKFLNLRYYLLLLEEVNFLVCSEVRDVFIYVKIVLFLNR